MAKTPANPTKAKAAAPKRSAIPAPVMKSDEFTPQQRAFVMEYLKDTNGGAAYIRAGYQAKNQTVADSCASKLLRIPKVAAAIQSAMDRRAEKCEISAERVLREIAAAAFLDPIELFTERGTLKALEAMPEGARRAIASIVVEELFEGQGEDRRLVGYLKKIRFVSKEGTLGLAGKHLKMFTDVVKHEGNVALTVVTGVPDGDEA